MQEMACTGLKSTNWDREAGMNTQPATFRKTIAAVSKGLAKPTS